MDSHPTGLRLTWWSRPAGHATERPVVVTGVFDLLHVGHVRFLTAVRRRGFPLFVGVEDDARVRAWKGPERPVNPAAIRAEVLAALRVVDAVFIISGDPEGNTTAHYLPLLAELRPAAIAFTIGDRYEDAKRVSAASLGAEAWAVPHIPGISTTSLIDRIRSADAAGIRPPGSPPL